MARSWSVRAVCSLLLISLCFFAFAAAKGLEAEIDDRYNLVRRQGTGSLPNATSSAPVDTATETETATITETDVETTTVTPTPTTGASSPSAPDSSSDAETSSDAPTPSSTPDSTVTTTSTTRRTTRTSVTETATAEPSTSTFIGTTTDERGAPSTFTSIVIVRPTHTPSRTATGTPGLQSDVAAPMMRKELFAVLGGAFAVAMLV